MGKSPSIERAFSAVIRNARHSAASASGTGQGFVVPPDNPTVYNALQVPMMGIEAAPGAALVAGDGANVDNSAVTYSLKRFQDTHPSGEEFTVLSFAAYFVEDHTKPMRAERAVALALEPLFSSTSYSQIFSES